MNRVVIIGSHAEFFLKLRVPLCLEMIANDCEVFALLPAQDDEKYFKEISLLGIKCVKVSMSRTGMNPFVDLKTLYEIYRTLINLKPQIVLSYTAKPVIYGSIAARLAKIPFIASLITGLGYAFIGNSIKKRITNWIQIVLYRLALSGNKKIFFQNHDDCKLFIDRNIARSAERCVVLNGTGVDIDLFKKTPLPGTVSFLMIARHTRDKGLYEYIEAIRQIKKEYPETACRLAGWMDTNPAAVKKSEIDEWINDGLIEYLGKLDDVRPAIADCSVYVLPSYREGMPRTVLEAMAMGRPVITTDAAGCRETVQNGVNGFLVPVRNSEKLLEAMKYFIEHPDELEIMGDNSRNIAEDKYDIKKVNAKMILECGITKC